MKDLGEAGDEGVDVGSLRSILHVLLGHVAMTAIADVVCNAPVEEASVLRHPSHLPTPPPQCQVLHTQPACTAAHQL